MYANHEKFIMFVLTMIEFEDQCSSVGKAPASSALNNAKLISYGIRQGPGLHQTWLLISTLLRRQICH